jgi:hypothetical protein
MRAYSPKPLESGFPKAEMNAVLEAMRHVLHTWAYLPSFPIGMPVEGPANLPLERSVRLSGRALAYVNIRTSPELSLLLSQYAQGETDTKACEDAFYEFVNIFCGHLMTYLWGTEGVSFEPYLPIPTTPADWPQAEPTSSCAFIVENIPIEVRLWIKEGQA